MPRLLFDEPLAEQLCDLLADLFPDSKLPHSDLARLLRERHADILQFELQGEAAVLELG